MKTSHIIILLSFISGSAFAGVEFTTISGRILKSDGTPLVSASVPFALSITDPSGSCVIFQESISSVDMSNSRGDFELQMGSGSRTFPASGTFPITAAFDNSSVFTCSAGGTYTSVAGDNRKVKVQFMDNGVWKTFTPSLTLNSAPRAFFASSAEKLGTNVATDFLLKAGLPTCTAGDVLTYNGTSLTCTTVSGSGSFAGDISGTQSAISVDKIKGVAVSMTGNSTGKVLQFNGTEWAPTSLTGMTSITAGTGLTGGTITSTGTIGLGTELSGLNGLTATGVVQRTGTGVYSAGSLNLASQVSGTLPVANGGTGATSFSSYGVIASNSSGNQVSVPGSSSGTMLQWSVTGPVWTNTSYPSSTFVNQLLYSSANNFVTGLPSTANAALQTDSSGTPMWVSTSTDAYSQYAFLSGRSGGQILKGGVGAAETLTLESTANSTKGALLLNPNGGFVGVGTAAPAYLLHAAETRSDTANASFYTQYVRQVVSPSGSSAGSFSASFNYSLKAGNQDAAQINSSYNRAENASSGGTVTDLIAAKNIAITSSLTLNSYGALNQSTSTGGNLTASYGAYNDSNRSGNSGTTTQSYGSYNVARNTGPGITTTGYGTYAEIKNSGGGTLTNGYGVYIGSIEASNKWSLYASDTSAVAYFGGYVGIGTTTPANPLEVAGRIKAASLISSGNVGIGTPSPTVALDVIGDVHASGLVAANGTTLTSDRRFKQDIQPLADSLEKISNLRGVSYRWRQQEFPERHFNDREQVGVIAQEVEKEFPALVLTDDSGYKSVNYSALVAPLIEAVKELSRRIDSLIENTDNQARSMASTNERTTQLEIENQKIKAQAEQLGRENAELKKRLDAIEARINNAP